MRNKIVIFFLLIMICNTISSQEIVKSETNYCFMEMNGNSRSVQSCSYTIHNNNTTRMVLLFIEDDNTSRPYIELLKRKMLHRYGDFSLSMLEWEANMDVEHGCMVIPELFVKIIPPHESFSVFYCSEEGSDVIIKDEILKHLLLCNERDFSNTQIGLPNIVKCMENYNYCYPHSFIILNDDVLGKFIKKKRYGINTEIMGTGFDSQAIKKDISRFYWK